MAEPEWLAKQRVVADMPEERFLLESERDKNKEIEAKSLLHQLQRDDKLHLISQWHMLEAKRCYVIKCWSPKRIAKRLKIDEAVIYRWKTLFAWDEARQHRERKIYWKALGAIKQVEPDIDVTHTTLATKLESIIESRLDDLLEDPRAADLKSIKELTSALSSIVQLRRQIAGKVQKRESTAEHKHVHVHEVGAEVFKQNDQAKDSVTKALSTHIQLPKLQTEPEAPNSSPIIDVEFEEQDDS